MLNSVNQIKLVSFDIFDTTLIRKCGIPNNVFYILSKKLFPNNISLQNDFYNWRIHVEDSYYRINTKVEPNLYHLYKLLPIHFGRFYCTKEIIELELETELDNLVANSEIKTSLGSETEIHPTDRSGIFPQTHPSASPPFCMFQNHDSVY